MHELSVAMALLDQIEATALPRDAIRVHRATIRVGPLSGVEPDLLMRAFDVARLARSTTTQTVLMIETAEVRAACPDCGGEGPVPVNNLTCTHCGGRNTRLLHGDELLLLQVEFDVPESPTQGAGAPTEHPRGEHHV